MGRRVILRWRIGICGVGSVVESSPATRRARVRSPAGAECTVNLKFLFTQRCVDNFKVLLRFKLLILSKQLYGQLFVQNTNTKAN